MATVTESSPAVNAPACVTCGGTTTFPFGRVSDEDGHCVRCGWPTSSEKERADMADQNYVDELRACILDYQTYLATHHHPTAVTEKLRIRARALLARDPGQVVNPDLVEIHDPSEFPGAGGMTEVYESRPDDPDNYPDQTHQRHCCTFQNDGGRTICRCPCYYRDGATD